MSKGKKAKDEGIHILYSNDVDEEQKKKIGSVLDIFQGPLFEQMVRDTVSEFCLEARLIYDFDTDEFYELEDHLKLIAQRIMEQED